MLIWVSIYDHICKELGDGVYSPGACMKNLNVTIGDSRDSEERKRFFPFHPQHHIIPSNGKKDWAYYLYTQYIEVRGNFSYSISSLTIIL